MKQKICLFDIINSMILIVFTLLCFYPFYYVLINSISLPEKAGSIDTVLIPYGFSLETYSEVLKTNTLYSSILVSVARALSGTALHLFFSAMYAFVATKTALRFTRHRIPVIKIMYRISIASMYISAGLIPWYIVMVAYGLKDNFFVYIIPGMVGMFSVILIKTYMESIPAELEESAVIDGAGYFTVFLKMSLPLSLPVLAAIAVFSMVGAWNSWFDNLMLVRNSKLQTVSLMLLNILRESEALAEEIARTGKLDASKIQMKKITPVSIRLASTMIVTVPIIMVYPFLQKYFVKGIMMGAIKG
jgi:ABC-type glycerol-3-phosphate transport system permease component